METKVKAVVLLDLYYLAVIALCHYNVIGIIAAILAAFVPSLIIAISAIVLVMVINDVKNKDYQINTGRLVVSSLILPVLFALYYTIELLFTSKEEVKKDSEEFDSLIEEADPSKEDYAWDLSEILLKYMGVI